MLVGSGDGKGRLRRSEVAQPPAASSTAIVVGQIRQVRASAWHGPTLIS
jgi:hypothetical protein